MKILLANIALERLAGSETWTMTMFNELSKEHEVDVYVHTGPNNLIMAAAGDPGKEYDLAIINHNSCLLALAGWNIKRRIFTSHGVIPHLEQPMPGADIYVSVSEEVQGAMRVAGYESVILRNPIATDYFTPTTVNKKLRRVLWMNNRAPHIDMIEKASTGLECMVVTGWQDGVRAAMQWADLVCTSGRGVYEALSCGKNAMVVNWCGIDGMVTPESILELRKCNCSGRRYGYQWNPAEIRAKMFEGYDSGRDMRGYILENNNVCSIAREYFSL